MSYKIRKEFAMINNSTKKTFTASDGVSYVYDKTDYNIINKIMPHGIYYSDIKHKVYKYKLEQDFIITTPIKGFSFYHKYFKLEKNGTLIIRAGYCWNGATGAIQTITNLRGALVHDALYQIISSGWLPKSYRAVADSFFIRLCRQDGMNIFRSIYFYVGVRLCGWMFC